MTEEERAARYSDLFGTGGHDHEHASDCAYCPICSVIAVVRNTKPEVLEHLANAARELIVAAGMLLEEAENVVGRTDETVGKSRKDEGERASSDSSRRTARQNVTRIDLG
ncbi:MAG: hypothetical protein JJE05_00290 [Actinobacteria bacterium]|nr:hypothetical protein [Actinomycetota bacterium]